MLWIVGGVVALGALGFAYMNNMLCGIGLCSSSGWGVVANPPGPTLTAAATLISNGVEVGYSYTPMTSAAPPEGPQIQGATVIGPFDANGNYGATLSSTGPYYAMTQQASATPVWYQHA